MRFDDSLATVLAADARAGAGANATWRQLLDLLGRGRVALTGEIADRVRALRPLVPVDIRVASARMLALEKPSASLVGLIAEDELRVAAPILERASLSAPDWPGIVAALSPQARGVLRARRDLPGDATDALARFEAADFVLIDQRPRDSIPEAGPQPSSQIADLVERIDNFRRQAGRSAAPRAVAIDRFAFRTNRDGTVCAVDETEAAFLIGVRLDRRDVQGLASVAQGLPARRSTHRDTLSIAGDGAIAGRWAIELVPTFADPTGGFDGYDGIASRVAADAAGPFDTLRQLVHELRTPINAVTGFAELIESELLGPVSAIYRERAVTIRVEALALVAAIEDLDVLARIEAGSLRIAPTAIALDTLVARAQGGLPSPVGPLVEPVSESDGGPTFVMIDDRLGERLIARVLELAVAMGGRVAAKFGPERDRAAVVVAIAASTPDEEGMPPPMLLGVATARSFVDRLSVALGASVEYGEGRLTLWLPLASVPHVIGDPDPRP